MCDMQQTSKYTERPSPPFPANQCCGEVKRGNDGRMYKSERVGAQKVCTWKLVASGAAAAKTSPKPKRAAAKKSPKPKRAGALSQHTVPHLRNLARERGIRGYSKLRKDELLALL